ncbi:MAG TPA: hypothetical protein VJP58_05510 [Candidatus Nitrosocosmicus sp.]|nr:hypothetical protein [Candidatus Nitrosocosmicus sp.]
MTNKSNSTKVTLFVVFVLASAIFSVNGQVFAQQNATLSEALNVTDAGEQNLANQTDSVPVEAELLPTTTNGSVTDDASSATPRPEVDEYFNQMANGSATPRPEVDEYFNELANGSATPRPEVEAYFSEMANGTAHDGTITRDSQTVLLEGESLPAQGNYIHLYDSTPYQIMNGHIAAKLPCTDTNSTEINVLIGQAPNLQPAELEFVGPLSIPGDLCLYHADVASNETAPITDIAIQNNSPDDITFPPTSTVVIGVNEIAPLASSEDHHE